MANQKIITAAVASSSMSKSSSSSSKSPDPYEVFLSFRGADTRQNFTSHLYEALSQKKIKTFIDNKLESGDEISPALMKAIEESQASIIIFSENYASSTWCLEELIKILECKENEGQLVIPVFYKVEPLNVRWQKGSYKEAFEKHEQNTRQNKEKVLQWRAALNKAATLSGRTWKPESDRTESEFIKDIVGDVLKKLDPGYPIELKGLVGIEESCAEIESLLEIGGSEVRSIGIWGMGGIGKTTLATAVFAKSYSSFEGHCFLSNVSEEYKKNGPSALRTKLFSELLKKENLNFNALGELPKIDMTRLGRTKVLIVLDDVATLRQLEDLIPNYFCLGLGSRVIVTSRNKHVYSNIVNEIYQVKLLTNDDSIKLFCANAFSEKYPKNGYGELLKSVITYCKGNPLALKVLGTHLCGKSKEVWGDKLRKLETIPNPQIQNVLKLSYDDLDDTEKDIFLDIACFYKGEFVDHVTNLLEACDLFPVAGIAVLLEMALITISNGTIQMHDLIQEMGRTIVREESICLGRRSRLWNPEEVYDVLKYNRGTEMVQVIRLNLSTIRDLNLSFDPFSKMINLRMIEFYSESWSNNCNVFLPDDLGTLIDKLSHFHWDGYCLKSLPPNNNMFLPKMIVKISIPKSKLEKLCDEVQEFQNLKKNNLSGDKHLVEVPDLSMAPNLVQVYLMHCVSLRQIYPSILSLPKLKYLTLIDCEKIESLTNDIHLKFVNDLRQECCSPLKQISATTEALQHLDLSVHPCCCSLKTLPDNNSRSPPPFSSPSQSPPSAFPPPPSTPPLVVVSPCAACKILRRRCVEKCVLAPYFPPTDPIKFTIAHRVFGASNIIKFLQELPEPQRADAVSSMVYEANARIRDPVYGCAGAICQLQKQVSELQAQLAKAQAEIVNLHCQQTNLVALICMEMSQSQDQKLLQPQQHIDMSCFLDDNSLGCSWEPLWT